MRSSSQNSLPASFTVQGSGLHLPILPEVITEEGSIEEPEEEQVTQVNPCTILVHSSPIKLRKNCLRLANANIFEIQSTSPNYKIYFPAGKMFPLPHYEPFKEKKAQAQVFVRQLNGGDIVQLDLGKKVSVPQDLMMEELSLPINRGSVLYQKRQKRVQNFVLEHPEGYKITSNWTSGTANSSDATHNAGGATEGQMAVHNAEGKENYSTALHMAASGKGAPPIVPKKTNKVLRMSRALNPNAIAPGYSGPLKAVPPEKFNSTAIPKGYQSPWREFLNSEDYQLDTENRLPEPPKKVNTLVDLRSFNRTPTPFGGLLLNDAFEMAEAQTDTPTCLELMLNRPSFNRAPQGWIHIMPESEEL